ncbi:MAG: hypothetical protein AAFX95_14880 [Cyanobacteria bacterium J06639_16]
MVVSAYSIKKNSQKNEPEALAISKIIWPIVRLVERRTHVTKQPSCSAKSSTITVHSILIGIVFNKIQKLIKNIEIEHNGYQSWD